MLDLETLGKIRPVVLSIACVPFDPEGDGPRHDHAHFHHCLKLEGQQERGLRIDPDTVTWWMGQSDTARLPFTIPALRCRVETVLIALNTFIAQHPGANVWAYGAASDFPWIDSLYATYDLPNPIHYRKARCLRTLAAVTGAGVPADYGGAVHNAYEDCVAQIKLCQRAYQMMLLSEPVAA